MIVLAALGAAACGDDAERPRTDTASTDATTHDTTTTATAADTLATETVVADTVVAETTIEDTVVVADTTIEDTVVVADTTIEDTVVVADTTIEDTVVVAETTIGDTAATDTTETVGPVGECGDGHLDPGDERCDGADLGGVDCASLGHRAGTLACAEGCADFDERGCVDGWDVGWCRLQWPPFIAAATGSSVPVYGRVWIPGLTDRTTLVDAWPEVVAALGVGPRGAAPTDPSWTWQAAAPTPGYDGTEWSEPDNDEYVAALVLGAPGDYDYAFRFSGDGGATWLLCDLYDGSADGYSWAHAGQLTVASEACADGDALCPSGCTTLDDDDCDPICGNGLVEPGEACDPASACPTTCDDGDACTIDAPSGAGCAVVCTASVITACADGDGCCPAGCSSLDDGDCSVSCGNGLVEIGETCDPPGACPTSCDDGNACTAEARVGSSANCDARCVVTTITLCADGDGCCPAGCASSDDDDCSPSCGDGLVEDGETCDPPGTCPASCDDGIACTSDVATGSAAECSLACAHLPISACAADGCCPTGCSASNDPDCAWYVEPLAAYRFDLALTASGAPWVLKDVAPGLVRRDGDAWLDEALPPAFPALGAIAVTSHLALDVSNPGARRIAVARGGNTGAAQAPRVEVWLQSGLLWTHSPYTTTFAPSLVAAAVRVNARGDVAALFEDPPLSGDQLVLAARVAGMWRESVVDPELAGAFDVAMDAVGQVHVCSFVGTALRHSRWTPATNTWAHEVTSITTGIARCAIALDAAGRPAILYLHGSLASSTLEARVARLGASGGWTVLVHPEPGKYFGAITVAIDAADRVHLALPEPDLDTLRHARFAAGTWATRRVEGVAAGHGGAIDLAVDAEGRAHVALEHQDDADLVLYVR